MSDAAVTGSRPSITAVQDAIIAELEAAGGTLEKYEHLVAIGRALPEPDDDLRQDAHAVPGCQSRVWIRSRLRDGRLHLDADAEALITRGLVALLLRVLDGRTPEEVATAELHFLDRSGLGAQLSPSRANGLANMVARIREEARAAAGAA